MNPQQALQLVDQALSSMDCNRATHDKLKQAVMTLRVAITQKPPKPETPKLEPSKVDNSKK